MLAYASGASREATLQPVVERAVELALMRDIERDVELARHRHSRVDVQVLAPSSSLRVRPLDFEGARLGSLIELSRADGRVPRGARLLELTEAIEPAASRQRNPGARAESSLRWPWRSATLLPGCGARRRWTPGSTGQPSW